MRDCLGLQGGLQSSKLHCLEHLPNMVGALSADMEVRVKLAILADAAKYDASCASSGSRRGGNGRGIGSTDKIGICHSYTPDGRCVSLLKILLTNYCIYDCQYCVNRITSDTPRARFTSGGSRLTSRSSSTSGTTSKGCSSAPASSRAPTTRWSSSSRSPAGCARTQHYNGYIHLKAVPGASEELIGAGRAVRRSAEREHRAADAGGSRRSSRRRRRTREIERTMSQMRVAHRPGEGRAGGEPTSARVRPGRAEHADDRRRDAEHRRDDPRHRVAPLRPAEASPRLLLRLQPDPARRRPPAARSRRRSSASIGSTRPTGSCGSTASTPAS